MGAGTSERWEHACGRPRYEFLIQRDRSPFLIDPTPVLKHIVCDVLDGVDLRQIAFEYHMALANAIAGISERVQLDGSRREVGLTGGVFQNSLLVHLTRKMLSSQGIVPWTHQRLSPNDGSLGLGQAWMKVGITLSSFYQVVKPII